VLLDEFLEPLALSQDRVAKDINVPARRINEIVHGKRAVTADTALRFAPSLRDVTAVLDESAGQYDLDVHTDV